MSPAYDCGPRRDDPIPSGVEPGDDASLGVPVARRADSTLTEEILQRRDAG